MNKPFLLFSIKCTVILYFAACTSIDHFTVDRSATPIITKGAWKVDLYADANKDKKNDLTGYNFVFAASGELKASKNGVEIKGNWSEDNISKRITINLGKTDPILARLNDYWSIKEIANQQVSLKSRDNDVAESLKITAL